MGRGRGKSHRGASSGGAGGGGSSGPVGAQIPPPSAVATTAPAAPAAPSGGGGVPDWLSDLFPQGGGGGGGQVSTLSEMRTSQPQEVPLHLVPLLMADDNAAIKRIMAASGADIALRQDMQHLGYGLAIISGTAQAVATAKALLFDAIGLGSLGGSTMITKEVEAGSSCDVKLTGEAVEIAALELRPKANNVPIRILPPEGPGQRVKVSIGPGQVAHVSAAEQLVKKKVAEVELEQCYRLGRPVPPELKIPVICKYYRLSTCSSGAKCQYCHTPEEIAVARKATHHQSLWLTAPSLAADAAAAVKNWPMGAPHMPSFASPAPTPIQDQLPALADRRPAAPAPVETSGLI